MRYYEDLTEDIKYDTTIVLDLACRVDDQFHFKIIKPILRIRDGY